MQFRSIISVFIVACLIIVIFVGNVAESGNILDNSNKQNFFVQRLRRTVRNTNQRYRRQFDNDDSNIYDTDSSGSNIDDGSNSINAGSPKQQNNDQGKYSMEVN
ncbi:unnamed protein product [Rotaria sp. Silwood1]|nr:unnamed protein product [Rotaria sp. Silwood1]CAF3672931.1 unnamed protein product [Rotaria sp. Silwood1]CAF3806550.1 unnamed protein product [Rotaria sp. Silwood1]